MLLSWLPISCNPWHSHLENQNHFGRVFQSLMWDIAYVEKKIYFSKTFFKHLRCSCSELNVLSKEPIPFKRTVFSRCRVSSLPKLSISSQMRNSFSSMMKELSIFRGAILTIHKAGGRREGMGLSAGTL